MDQSEFTESCEGIGLGFTCPQPKKTFKSLSLDNSWPAETRDCQRNKGFDGDEKKLDSEGRPKQDDAAPDGSLAGSKHHFC